jgi:hypothetical protein
MSRILDDLNVLVEHDQLNQGMFDRFSAAFGIISEGGTFRFDQERACVGQSLWSRTENGEVTTRTGHSERIHREANTQCPRSPNLLGSMAMLIPLVTRRFESGSKFQAEQARKELRRLNKIQKVAGPTPAQQCPSPRCGCQAVCARRYGIRSAISNHKYSKALCQMAEMNSFQGSRRCHEKSYSNIWFIMTIPI